MEERIREHVMGKLREMQQSRILCDLELVSGEGESVFVHSLVWMAAFEDMTTMKSCFFKDAYKRLTKLDLPDVESKMLKTVVDFIYGDCICVFPEGFEVVIEKLGLKNSNMPEPEDIKPDICLQSESEIEKEIFRKTYLEENSFADTAPSDRSEPPKPIYGNCRIHSEYSNAETNTVVVEFDTGSQNDLDQSVVKEEPMSPDESFLQRSSVEEFCSPPSENDMSYSYEEPSDISSEFTNEPSCSVATCIPEPQREEGSPIQTSTPEKGDMTEQTLPQQNSNKCLFIGSESKSNSFPETSPKGPVVSKMSPEGARNKSIKLLPRLPNGNTGTVTIAAFNVRRTEKGIELMSVPSNKVMVPNCGIVGRPKGKLPLAKKSAGESAVTKERGKLKEQVSAQLDYIDNSTSVCARNVISSPEYVNSAGLSHTTDKNKTSIDSQHLPVSSSSRKRNLPEENATNASMQNIKAAKITISSHLAKEITCDSSSCSEKNKKGDQGNHMAVEPVAPDSITSLSHDSPTTCAEVNKCTSAQSKFVTSSCSSTYQQSTINAVNNICVPTASQTITVQQPHVPVNVSGSVGRQNLIQQQFSNTVPTLNFSQLQTPINMHQSRTIIPLNGMQIPVVQPTCTSVQNIQVIGQQCPILPANQFPVLPAQQCSVLPVPGTSYPIQLPMAPFTGQSPLNITTCSSGQSGISIPVGSVSNTFGNTNSNPPLVTGASNTPISVTSLSNSTCSLKVALKKTPSGKCITSKQRDIRPRPFMPIPSLPKLQKANKYREIKPKQTILNLSSYATDVSPQQENDSNTVGQTPTVEKETDGTRGAEQDPQESPLEKEKEWELAASDDAQSRPDSGQNTDDFNLSRGPILKRNIILYSNEIKDLLEPRKLFNEQIDKFVSEKYKLSRNVSVLKKIKMFNPSAKRKINSLKKTISRKQAMVVNESLNAGSEAKTNGTSSASAVNCGQKTSNTSQLSRMRPKRRGGRPIIQSSAWEMYKPPGEHDAGPCQSK